ncbi:TSUP family transporter [Polynucleobacter sp. 71A-WALBACH]|uniref:sulfite exporter TauE/SafE family protein n=1 Tax=Polynucleobacter sp. 71A-WALBACH TaxID=2689097 RepID=UPI001C0C458F|nr:TSUP family transporter [Polynucleobacter sp. 71A-WALBACH]MBU3593659.1 TSUP family transporter [Polynucleobacter sp. 71A-WALBACH]
MFELSFFDLSLLLACALFAGLVDSIIGGGGMIQIPALFAVLPGFLPATLLSVNKFGSIVGTIGAAIQYSRANRVPWGLVVISSIFAFCASVAGAYLVTQLPTEWLRGALPFLLIALLLFNIKSSIGLVHAPKHQHHKQKAIASAGASIIGFYDGFLGPGAGAFYKLLYTRILGFDFLRSAAPAKFLNIASNLGALCVFFYLGYFDWKLGLLMASANLVGGQIGTKIAIKHGNSFIRKGFFILVTILIMKTFYDAFLK